MTKSKQLFPITMRPGIKRDGSPFQSEYCIDGDWVRWQKGMPRSMNGLMTPAQAGEGYNDSMYSTSNILALPSIPSVGGVTSTVVHFGTNSNIQTHIIRDPESDTIRLYENRITPFPVNPLILWQSLVMKRNGYDWILFYGCPTAHSTTATYGLTINFGRTVGNSEEEELAPFIPNVLKGVEGLRDIDGGAVWAAPYLFLYGTNGTVRISRQVDPFDFRTDVAQIRREDNIVANVTVIPAQVQQLTVSDKVIYGAPIRGGGNSPTLLFWTASSLIRLSNVSTTTDIAPIFKPDPISTAISILSPKCVVEYDGLFFWIGTDRFYVYNGNVSEIPNTVSIDNFFRKLDRDSQSLVFGVKMPRFGEIWWFYPTFDRLKGSQIKNVLIYNKRENSWYDTILPATAGFYAPFLGQMITMGSPKVGVLPAGLSPQGAFLWFQNPELRGEYYFAPTDGVSFNPTRETYPITSFFTTPYFSFAAFNPLKQQVGEDHQTIINRLEPCFISPDGEPTYINVNVNTLRYPQSTPVTHVVDDILINVKQENAAEEEVTVTTERIDMAIQGGNINFTFTSTGAFEMGHSSVLISLGDGNR